MDMNSNVPNLSTISNTNNNNMSNMSNMSLTDKDIANDLLKDSKFSLTGLTMALAESTNPQLRQMLSEQLNSCIAEHHRLSDIAINKNWYPAFESPQQQIQTDLQEAQNLLR